MLKRPLFSICIPAYNRSKYLEALLDSIFSQNFINYEIVICEDLSPERDQISAIVVKYQTLYPMVIAYCENEANLGYDGNIRELVKIASGRFCFFMGNDDLMAEGALANVARLVSDREDVGMVLKSYAWFEGNPNNIIHSVRYFAEECEFFAGSQAIHACYRRSGVISGYIVNRDAANEVATPKFDGSLYYQMHLTAQVLVSMSAIFTPNILVLCRSGVPPDFGNSSVERGSYTPGSFTPQARLNMVAGALAIIQDLKNSRGIDVVKDVMSDYANYFYPFIKDQLKLPIREYWNLYKNFYCMGFYKYPMFHAYFLVAYIIGEVQFDWLMNKFQVILGRSMHFGRLKNAGALRKTAK